jgi:hypothetical protein
MPTIEFRGKPEKVYNMDDTLAFTRIKVPAIKKHHCDMNEFRSHRKYSGLANSTLFPAMVARELREMGIRDYLILGDLPNGVEIDLSGFLANVTINLQ